MSKKVRLSASIEIIGIDVNNGTNEINRVVSKSFDKGDLTYDTTLGKWAHYIINTPLCIPHLMDLFPTTLVLSVNGKPIDMKNLKP